MKMQNRDEFNWPYPVLMLFICMSLFCADRLNGPALSTMHQIDSKVSQPVLSKTLPGSWDENWFSSVAVYDLDNDGVKEVIAARHSVVYVWNADGTMKWRAPVGENSSSKNDHGTSRIYCSPVVGDLDNDSKGEIAVCYSNKVAVYDQSGMLQSGWPQAFPGSGDEIRSLASGDLDNDGYYELIAVKTSKGPVTCVWSINGLVRSGWPQVKNDTTRNNYGGYNQNVGIADLDNNGVADIVFTYDICHFGIMKPDGSEWMADKSFGSKPVSGVPMFHDISLARQGWGADGNDRDEFTDSPPVMADIDSDGSLEIILFSDHERAGEYKNRGNSLWVLNPDMTRPAGFEKPLTTGMPLYTGYQDNIVQVAPAPCISHLDNNRIHVIVPSYDGNLYCFDDGGAVRWRLRFDSGEALFTGCSEAVAGDLDKDGVPEVIFCTYSTDKDVSNLFILNASGELLHRVKLFGRGSMAAPTLDDVDGDGSVEIIVSLKDALGGKNSGVQIWKVQSAGVNGRDWPTGRGNYLRTGLFGGRGGNVLQ